MRRISIFLVMVLAMSVAPLAFAEAPSNDNLAAAEVVTAPFSDTTNTSEATTEVGEIGFGCGGDLHFDPRPNKASIWYSFTPSVETRVFGSTVGSDYDTVVGVYVKYGEAQVTSYDNLYMVMCEDQENEDVFDFWASGGETYYIQIAAHANETPGIATLSIEVAGTMSGTVTDATGAPLAGICINVSSDSGAELDGPWDGGWAVTDVEGTYHIASLSGGDYVVSFYDCEGNQYEYEYYSDKSTWNTADRVPVARGAAVTGIDASLALRPPPPPPVPSDVAIKSLTVENVPLKTDNGTVGYTGFQRKIHLSVENLGPNGSWGEIQVRACPKGDQLYVPFVGSMFNGCQWIAWDWDWQAAGTTKTYTFGWNSSQMFGDVTIEAVACPSDYGTYDPNTANNKASVDHYSMVSGSGLTFSRYESSYWDYFGCDFGPIAVPVGG